jgi:hypothetical protein
MRLSLVRLATIAGAVATGVCVPAPAGAFERQWHVGGGVGLATESGGYDIGPVLGVHGAYGISDVFDVRLELQASRNDLAGFPVWFYATRAGIAYKLDVLQWIPYVGASGGGFFVTWSSGTTIKPCVGAFAGLDYAVSEHVGVGVLVAGDYVLANPNLLVGTGLFRAEYRFGF